MPPRLKVKQNVWVQGAPVGEALASPKGCPGRWPLTVAQHPIPSEVRTPSDGTRASHILCSVQCKMKMWDCLFRKQEKGFFLSSVVSHRGAFYLLFHATMLLGTWGRSMCEAQAESHRHPGPWDLVGGAGAATDLPALCLGSNWVTVMAGQG